MPKSKKLRNNYNRIIKTGFKVANISLIKPTPILDLYKKYMR